MSRQASKNGGAPKYRDLRPERPRTPNGELPHFDRCDRFLDLLELCLRLRIYLGLWAGRDGAIVFIDVLNGQDRRRYEASTDAELRGIIDALYEEFYV